MTGFIKKASRGFTLIEVLVISGLTAIILLATVSVFMTFLVNQARISNRQEVKNAGESALGQITQALRGAQRIDSCTPNMQNSVSYIDVDNQLGSIIRSDNSLWLGDINLTPSHPHLETTSFTADCYDGPSQHIVIRFTLRNPSPRGLRTDEITQDFRTSITLRN